MKKMKVNHIKIVVGMLLGLILVFTGKIQAKAAGVSWKVTQYGQDADRGQSMFYTIKGSNGKFIVVDGGWAGDQYRVRNVINQNGGRVDIWIITHPHPDHAGAFNRIMASPQGIRIRWVFAPKIDSGRYSKYKKPWDDYPTYQRFMSIIAGKKKIRWLKAGESLDYYGLHMDIFNSYSSSIGKTTRDICNGSSLVFKISGSRTSMLFTGDIPAKTGTRLIRSYGKKIRATYLQAPHHGNNMGRKSFFKYIRAKAVFIDAQAGLRNYNSAIQENMRIIRNTGSRLYTYSNRKSVLIR